MGTMTIRNGSFQRLREQGMAMWLEGRSDYYIATVIGCARSSVRYWRRKNNLPANPWGEVLDRLDTEGRRLHANGLNDRQIAKALNTQHGYVAEWRKKRGLPTNCVNGSEDWYATLPCVELNAKLIELHKCGYTDREGAERMGVTLAAYKHRRLRLKLKANGRRYKGGNDDSA